MIRWIIFSLIWLLPTLCYSANFEIHWNVPSEQCHKYGMNFSEIHDKFAMIQNTGDTIIGDKVAILYRPGKYPYIEFNSDKSIKKIVNGGVPQEVNLTEHLEVFRNDVNTLIPSNFSGFGIISFVDWRPLFYQNYGGHRAYETLSINLTTGISDESARKAKAKKQFEEHAKLFMEKTMELAKKLRPYARWGYHDYHNCFDFVYQENEASCPLGNQQDNDKLSWLWKSEQFLNPLLRVGSTWLEKRALHRIATTINEAKRLIQNHNPAAKIIPYLTLSPERGKYINKDIAKAILKKLVDQGSDGVFIWEETYDLDSEVKCKTYHDYIGDVFGPAVVYALVYSNPLREKFEISRGNNTMNESITKNPLRKFNISRGNNTMSKFITKNPLRKEFELSLGNNTLNESTTELTNADQEDSTGHKNIQSSYQPLHVIIYCFCFYFARILI